MAAPRRQRGGRGGRARSFAKEIGYLSHCKSAGQRKAFLKGTPARRGLLQAIQWGCSQVLQRGGQLSPAIRSRLARQRTKLIRGAKSQRGAGLLLQTGGSFLGDLWKGVTSLLGI
jgi:hypothetical protein